MKKITALLLALVMTLSLVPPSIEVFAAGGETFLEWNYGRTSVPRPNNHWPATLGAEGIALADTNLAFYYADGARAILGRNQGDRLAVNVPNRNATGGGQWHTYYDWFLPPWAQWQPWCIDTAAGWVITLSTIGWENINFSARQASSTNGPGGFGLAYRAGTSGEWSNISDRTWQLVSTRTNYPRDTIAGVTFQNVPLPNLIANQPTVQIKLYITGEVRLGGDYLAAWEGNTSINNIVFRGERTNAPPPVRLVSLDAPQLHNILSVVAETVDEAIALLPQYAAITTDPPTYRDPLPISWRLAMGTFDPTPGRFNFFEWSVTRPLDVINPNWIPLSEWVIVENPLSPFEGARAAAEQAIIQLPVSNDTTAEDFENAVEIAIAPFATSPAAITFAWHEDFALTPATPTLAGEIRGVIRLTMDDEELDVTIHRVIIHPLSLLVSLAQHSINTLSVSNSTTADEILTAVENGIAYVMQPPPPVTISWQHEFALTPATETASGAIHGTLRLTLDGEFADVQINRTIPQIYNPYRWRLDVARMVTNSTLRDFPATNSTTAAEILTAVNARIMETPWLEVIATWHGEITTTPASITADGRILGTIRLTAPGAYEYMTAEVTIPMIDTGGVHALAQAAANALTVSNSTTAADFISAIENAIAGAYVPVEISWYEDFAIVPATETEGGVITGTVRIAIYGHHQYVLISRTMPRTRVATQAFMEWDYGRFAPPRVGNLWPATYGAERASTNLAFYYIDGERATLGRTGTDRLAVNAPNRGGGNGDWWCWTWWETVWYGNIPVMAPVNPTANEAAGWIITLPTLGWENINFSASQSSSNNGPGRFGLAYRIGTDGDWISYGIRPRVSVQGNALQTGITFDRVQLPHSLANQPVIQIKIYIATAEVRLGGTLQWVDSTEGNTSINNIIFRGEPIPTSHTVTFDPNGGAFVNTATKTRIVQTGENIGELPRAIPSVFSRNGYRFMGWFENTADPTTRFCYLDYVTANITLYAKWERLTDPYTFRAGNVNDDNRVTSADATMVARYLAGYALSDFCPLAADLNGDGQVTPHDLILLARWLAGHNVTELIAK
ncbi:MAG: InlB B-repeat-containing protein [Defluviitaleaceae bacterium]|nr:InlB B-repeat-containing protein [Defluviitaleaceae bacterium]MCL2263978.1 InlB B-repeat-containing protein [Defluviitaleaceae bacterium]